MISRFCACSRTLLGDPHHLIGRLALGEDHFGHAVAQRAMMIHLGEPEVFERHVAEPLERAIGVHFTGAHLIEQHPELILVHKPRIAVASSSTRRS